MIGMPHGSAESLALMVAIGLLFAATGVSAQPNEERQVRVTVYNNNLGLVNEQRSLDLKAGRGTVEIQDVPALIDPTSVHLKPLQGDLQILEQNFQYDLAGPDRILDRYLDHRIQAVLEGGEVKDGTLLSFDHQQLVLRSPDGTVQMVSREQVVDLRFPELPEGLRTRPTLVWHLDSPRAGATPVEISYLTDGLNWHAEYVAVTNQVDTRMDLSAWVSLDNRSGASYPNARLQLIAGEVQRVQERPELRGRTPRADMMTTQAAKGFEEEAFFEYHLYTLERPTTLSDRETKQIALFPSAEAPVQKIYEYNGQTDPTGVRVVLEAENREANGLGMPLPGGKVRVYKKDARGDLQFVGEDRIRHTPRNEKIRLGVGKAFDIVGERKELSENRISERVREKTVEVRLRNRKEEAVEIVVQEFIPGDWTIQTSNVPFEKKDAQTAEFRVEVAADQEAVLTYTARIQY